METMQFSQQIAEFAKTNKIAKAKVENLVQGILSQVKPQGRSKTEEAAAFERGVLAWVQAGEKTMPAIRAKSGFEAVRISNALIALHKQGKIIPSGKVESKARGRKATIWTVI